MGCKTDANCEKKIKIGIVGYGNLGKACEKIALSDDKIELVGVFSRRNDVKSPFGTMVYAQDDIFDFDIDVALLCVGSQSDLTRTACKIAEKFNTVDSFDTHAEMTKYIDRMTEIVNNNVMWASGGIQVCFRFAERFLPRLCKMQAFRRFGERVFHKDIVKR